ncbi:MAG: GGDEF domain-containing protein [Rhizobiales bacterium]|nr:GGDEF domain-containing protein [Rhizobacter sp.]
MNPNASTAGQVDWADQVERALHVSDFESARQLTAEANACAKDAPARARAAFLAARCGFLSGEPELGLSHALDAAAAYESLGDSGAHARASALAARCLLTSGDGGSALDHALVSLRAARKADPDSPSAALLAALSALGIVYRSLGQLDAARDYCQQALDCAIGLGDRLAQGTVSGTLACVYSSIAAVARERGLSDEAERQEREAIRCSAEALQIAREEGHLRHAATAVNNLADSMSLVGEAPQALRLLEDWARDNPCDVPRVRLHHLETLGAICMALGQTQQAREWFERALADADTAEMEITAVRSLASACEAGGDYRAALTHFQRFHALHVQLAAAAAQRSARVAAVRMDTEGARARAVALARDNAQLQKHADTLLRQSTEDPLTGLANRRRFDEILQAGHEGYAAAMIDVDHFKNVNDRFSHAVGDAVLCQLAALLRETCRSVDTPVRLGGEEFVVLLPSATAAAAAAAAERLRTRIEAFDWATLATGLAVTVSIGVAMGSEAGSAAALLALADQRLYAAKRSGRNRVVCT